MVESLREREVLYKLIISQLRYDGLDMVAANLAKCVGLETTPLSPSSRLLGLMKLGIQEEKNGIVPDMETPPGLVPPIPPARGLDLEYETEGSSPIGKEKSTSDSNTFHARIFIKQQAFNLKRGTSVTRTQSVPIGASDAGQQEAPLDKSSGLVEIDIAAQPTMIACKEDAYLEHTSQDTKCSSELVHTSGRKLTAGRTFEISNPCIKLNKAEDKTETTLSSIIDFNPKNKGKLTDRSQYTAEYISKVFKPYREQLCFENFKDLVSAEVINFGINQSIFSKTVLKRSQGYLSDLLNRQEAIMNMEEPSRMFANFVKMKDFLDLGEEERRLRYYECVKESEAEQNRGEKSSLSKISRRKKRMSFSKGVKESLKELFKGRLVMPDYEELVQISEQFDLEITTVKNFFRNFKARSRLSIEAQ